MPNLEMGNSVYCFDEKTINKTISDNCTGNFALGYINENDMFVVCYVGRSENNLKCELKKFIGKNKVFKSFKFTIKCDDIQAYYLECKNYHDFGEKELLLNKNHPIPPRNKILKCPYCGNR